MSKNRNRMQWYRMDLHLHTPASLDYKDKDASYIDILRRAEQRGIDIIAFTDHNTVRGYDALLSEIEQLTFLEQTNRARADELRVLAEYRRLLDKILVLPGFEFSATFGFHVLSIFSPETSTRYIEHLLLSLNVPADVIARGDPAAGSTADVLDCYQIVNEAGGIVIAAHINASHGVMMRGLNFGGQTRIAYTQDRHLHALELTDLYNNGRNSTQRFFSGTKPEYPRRMHLVQGSDAHSLDSFQEGRNRRYGIGERVTEVMLPERSFEALKDMFINTDFSRVRPYNPNLTPYDYILAAREEGPSLVQSFHESVYRKGGNLHAVIADVCAFANTNGGAIYVGLSQNKRKSATGVENVLETMKLLQTEISRSITPSLDLQIDVQETQGKNIIRILVPFGEDRPYAVSDNNIYLREEAETSLAVRDEIVNLVEQGIVFRQSSEPSATPATVKLVDVEEPFESTSPVAKADGTAPPRSGVEVVGFKERDGTRHYQMHDLRNGRIVSNVTRSSARKLWHYAIKEHEAHPPKDSTIEWKGDIGLQKRYRKGGATRFDLAQRNGDNLRVYYGVSDNGMHGPWEAFIEENADDSES